MTKVREPNFVRTYQVAALKYYLVSIALLIFPIIGCAAY